jgi:hypothetical protein
MAKSWNGNKGFEIQILCYVYILLKGYTPAIYITKKVVKLFQAMQIFKNVQDTWSLSAWKKSAIAFTL